MLKSDIERNDRLCPNLQDRLIDELHEYENNPRNNEKAVDFVAESIKQFGFKVPIVVDANDVIVAGHTRLKAARKLKLEKVPVIVADDLTPEQIKAFRLADNKTAELAEWDFEKLETELGELAEIGFKMDDFGFEEFEINEKWEVTDDPEHKTLAERFIIPPFSVLDTRQGYWQDRKKQWLEKTGNLSETRDGDFGTIGGHHSPLMDMVSNNTSNFDPVFAEIMFKWFCVDGGKVLDPFGGEQTKGVVAGYLGYKYSAVEIRQEQVDLNISKTKIYDGINYICGDSNNISELIKDRDFDFCFTSPPYYDLEVYSNDDMSALGTYEEFMMMYRNIFEQCYKMLKNDSFLVVKVSEIRDKKSGEYRAFVADNVKLFQDIGFHFYNDIVLLNNVASLAYRAANQMNATRKVGRTHQNILVFYKGDLKNIKEKFPPLDFSEIIDSEETADE